jgi:hypothetical protein
MGMSFEDWVRNGWPRQDESYESTAAQNPSLLINSVDRAWRARKGNADL